MSALLHRLTREPVLAPAALLAVFLIINTLAVWGIVSGRRDAERAAQKEIDLRTRADARALEALLATLRADFLFLAQSPPIAFFLRSRDHDDPMVRRWSRLDVEGTFLLFLEARPALRRLVLKDGGGKVQVIAGRREGVPVLLPREASYPLPSRATGGLWPFDGETVFQGTFTLETPPGKLEVWLDTRDLMEVTAPDALDHLEIAPSGRPPRGRETSFKATRDGSLVARMPVTDRQWDPPIEWRLVRTEEEGELLRSLESLAGRYRTTVALNLAVMISTLLLGALALRQVRRVTRLEAENAQEKRVRELERQLMHSERLASVGRLAAGLAHEINNPLEGMSNYLALLAEDLAAGRHQDAPKLLAQVREGLDRTAGITRQVLAFSAPGAAPKDRLELASILRDAVAFVRASREYRAVEMELEVADGLRLWGNPISLGQVFLNLLLNACQAQDAGRGQGAGGRIDIRATEDGDEVVITVSDAGPGLSAAVREHLFEPFFSTRGSTGLGLAVCHGIVADHGGRIEGRNRAGGGAVFEVRLPRGEGR